MPISHVFPDPQNHLRGAGGGGIAGHKGGRGVGGEVRGVGVGGWIVLKKKGVVLC